MLTKRKTIELIQNRIAGAGTTADLRRRYPYKVIEVLISKVYADLNFSNPYAMQDMVFDYAITVSETAPYYADLEVQPIGSFSFVSVVLGDKFYPMEQGRQEGFVMSKIVPGRSTNVRLVQIDRGWKLEFLEKPNLFSGTATYVPNFDSMDENAPLIFAGKETALYNAVIDLLAKTDRRPGEQYNDGQDDAMPVPPKQQIVQ